MADETLQDFGGASAPALSGLRRRAAAGARVAGRARRKAMLAPVFTLAGLLFVWPAIMLVIGSFRSAPPFLPGRWSLAAWRSALDNPGLTQAVLNSLNFAFVTTTISLLIAVLLAFVSERTDAPLRRLITPALLLMFVIPGLFYAIAFTLLLNPYTGILNDALRALTGWSPDWLNAEGWIGIYAVLVLKKTPMMYLFIVGAFKALDAAQEEAARIAGASAWRALASVTLPGLAPALTSAALLGVVTGLQVFDPVLILGAKQKITVVSTLLMNQLAGATKPDYPAAAVISTVFVAFVGLLYIVQQRLLGERGFVSVAGKGRDRRPVRLRRARPLVAILVALYLVLSFVLPVGALVFASFQSVPGVYHGLSLQAYQDVLQWPRVWQALKVTAVLALTVGGLGVALAFGLAEFGRHLGKRGASILGFFTLLPMAMPGVVVAVAISWAYLCLPGLSPLYGSIWLIALALLVTVIPFASQIARAAVAQIAPVLSESARISGAGPVQTFFDVVLALAAPTFVAGWFMAAVGIANNLEAPLLLKSPGLSTLSVVAYAIQGSADFSQAAALLVLLVLLSSVLWLIGSQGYRLASLVAGRLSRRTQRTGAAITATAPAIASLSSKI